MLQIKDHLMLRLLFIDETLHEDGVKWTELIAIHSFFALHIIKVYMFKKGEKKTTATSIRAGHSLTHFCEKFSVER